MGKVETIRKQTIDPLLSTFPSSLPSIFYLLSRLCLPDAHFAEDIVDRLLCSS